MFKGSILLKGFPRLFRQIRRGEGDRKHFIKLI